MKKVAKGKKKLEVKKEKVRPLNDEDLDKVAGGRAVPQSQTCAGCLPTAKSPRQSVPL